MAKEQTGLAGEFWFFSQLQRLGYEAYITLGNTKSVDISLKLVNEILTFDVKSKLIFGGSFQYLKIDKRKNHFAVFVNLKAKKDNLGKTELVGEPSCYIVNSENLDHIAFNWESKSGTAAGYGFEDKLLWYLKHQDTKSITKKNILDFRKRHKLAGEIDFSFYNKIIWTLSDFEEYYYKQK
jgi:hypothetical protein